MVVSRGREVEIHVDRWYVALIFNPFTCAFNFVLVCSLLEISDQVELDQDNSRSTISSNLFIFSLSVYVSIANLTVHSILFVIDALEQYPSVVQLFNIGESTVDAYYIKIQSTARLLYQ